MELQEQENVMKNTKKNMLVSASAGSGKTYIMIKYITHLICEKHISVNELLVLTFTKAAATQLKERLTRSLKAQPQTQFIVDQIDALSTSNISTIHSFCEKFLKKYANILGLKENFAIIDDKQEHKLKQMAFDTAFEKFEKIEDNFQLISAFKNNKNSIFKIVQQIESLLAVVPQREEYVSKNLNDLAAYFDAAANFVLQDFQKVLKENFAKVQALHVADFEAELEQTFKAALACTDIFQLARCLKEFTFPKIPQKKVIGDESKFALDNIKADVVDYVKKINLLELCNDENVAVQREGKLEKLMLCLCQIYETEEEKIKKAQNVLGFDDLIKWMTILSEKQNLFDGFKYVFVDEYQDTNKVQERIIKNVAKNCNFVAVGDVKQGIYGFLLASAEIFLKDFEEFSASEDGQVNILKCNFRSNRHVLCFVNDVFKVCMTEQATGVDYANTSMLQGMADFADEGVKAVNIDCVSPCAQANDEIPEIYSVKDSKIFVDNKNEILLNQIKARIMQVLGSKISDNGVLRQATFKDIAILSRGRNTLFNQLETYLLESGILVVSNSRKDLMSQPEMKMLLSFLKCAFILDDDIAVCSVLVSGMFHKDLQIVAKIKNECCESLCEIVKIHPYFADFFEDLNQFRKNFIVYGIRHSLEILFQKTLYRAFINFNHPNLDVFVEKFLAECEVFDFDLPALIYHFEHAEIVVGEQLSVSEDAVLLTTIHDSKGLEYPVVFVIGCDQSLSGSGNKLSVEINERFGVALKNYNEQSNTEQQSLRMLAIKQYNRHKEWVEEMMIFYVALTRAKNRLYLFGLDTFNQKHGSACDCYFDFIFDAFNISVQDLCEKEKISFEDVEFNFVKEPFLNEQHKTEKNEVLQNSPEIQKRLEEYLNFSYNFGEGLNFKLKESVTELSNKNVVESAEDTLQKYNTESFNFGSKAVDIGNAYHFALKCLDFDKIENMNQLETEIKNYENFFDASLVDKNVLLKNIQILKELAVDGKCFKEKEFIMKVKLNEILPTTLQETVLVQGVVDLFIEKNNQIILVDYKYSSLEENALINKYKNQLKLYKIALNKAFNKDISQIYLLSLKNNNLISVDI